MGLVVWLVVVEQAVGVRVAEFVVEIGNGDHNHCGQRSRKGHRHSLGSL